MRFGTAGWVVLVGLAVAGGCKKENGSAGGGGEIKIGHVAALTGETATFGTSSEEGIRLALDEVNAKGGVLGKKITVITEDDRSRPEEAKTVANKLISQNGVVALLGEIASSNSIAMAPVAQDAKIPMVTPGSTNPKVTVDPSGEPRDFIFRACFVDTFQGKAVADFALGELKAKQLAILCPVNSDYGVGLRDIFKQSVEKAGAQIVASESYSQGSDVDFRSQLTKIKNAAPDAVFVPGYYNEAGLIAKQAKELGLTVPLLGGDGWDSDKTVAIGGAAIEGCYFLNHYSAEEDRPEVKAFVDAYKAKYKDPAGKPKVPDAMAIVAYDAMKLLADAIARAGSTDGTKIRDALAATKNFPAASGTITMDANHNPQKSIVILKIQGGEFRYVTTIKP